jgi:hypothetical protein
MVNRPLPSTESVLAALTAFTNNAWVRDVRPRITPQNPCLHAFAQILGKFYFFNLLENLRRILFDYGQNRSCTANVAFKTA